MSSPALIDFWKKLVEGVMSTSCLDIVLNLVVLVSYLTEDAIRLRTHLFSQLYIAELRTEKSEEKMRLPTSHQPFVFQTLRCCLRYHVLLQLLEAFSRQSKVSMIEIGVHAASTATFLLNRAPFLQWTGVDPYSGYGSVSGDQFYSEAMRKLKAFEGRARLLRMASSEAWDTTGPLQGPSACNAFENDLKTTENARARRELRGSVVC